MAYCVEKDYQKFNEYFKEAGQKIFSDKQSLLLHSRKYDNRPLKKFLEEVFRRPEAV